MRLWIVGQYRGGELGNVVWDFQGAFSTKDKAVKACRDESYFLTTFLLDEELPHETMIGYPTWYPHGMPEPAWPFQA